jgi:hypothetical protein
LELTPQGRSVAPLKKRPVNNAEMFRQCCSLLSGIDLKIFEFLYRKYPHKVDRATVGEALGLQHTSGHFRNRLGALRSKTMIEYPEPQLVKCSDWIFL